MQSSSTLDFIRDEMELLRLSKYDAETTSPEQAHSFFPMHLSGDMVSRATISCEFCKVPASLNASPLVSCVNCHLVCHAECAEALNDVLCSASYSTARSTLSKGPQTMTRAELYRRIKVYNMINQDNGLHMLMPQSSQTVNSEDNEPLIRGTIKIYLDLIRPVTVQIGVQPPIKHSGDDIPDLALTDSGDPLQRPIILPRNTVKVIQLASTTTTREVIAAVLRNVRIMENPQKFALYEKSMAFATGQSASGTRDTCLAMRRLLDLERPLLICLNWNVDTQEPVLEDMEAEDSGEAPKRSDRRRLVLQETSDSADIVWEAFSQVELRNFVQFLDREEQLIGERLRRTYDDMKQRVLGRINEMFVEATEHHGDDRSSNAHLGSGVSG